jgi:hypothetical protein
MNGIERLALQRKAGMRPIIEDIDELYINLGMENVKVMTPKVEVKLRSGEWGQIPMQVECRLDSLQYRINITFHEGYPQVLPLLFILNEEQPSPSYNASLRRFDPCEEYVISFTEKLREMSQELIGQQHLLASIIKSAKDMVDEVVPAQSESSPTHVPLIGGNDDRVVSSSDADRDSEEAASPDLFLYKCRYCRAELFTSEMTEPHDRLNPSQSCQNIFLAESPKWLSLDLEGKILCVNEKCHAKLGSWSWSGFNCSCGTWIAPSFQFSKGKIDPCILINMQR